MKELEENYVREIIANSKNKTEIIEKLGYYRNGNGNNKVTELIKKYKIDVSHFSRKDKLPRIEKKCPVCNKNFKTKQSHNKERTTCSISCSNTYFRSGVDHPNYKDISEFDKRSRGFCLKYRKICFDNHEHKCVVCDEKKILDVHHFDENKFNNEPENLIPICATHHNYLHSKYRDEVIDKVIKYRNEFINNKT